MDAGSGDGGAGPDATMSDADDDAPLSDGSGDDIGEPDAPGADVDASDDAEANRDTDVGAVDAPDADSPVCVASPPYPGVSELLSPVDGSHPEELDLCRGEATPFVSASAVRWYVRVEGVPEGTLVRIDDAYTADAPDRAPLATGLSRFGEFTASFETQRSGEHAVTVVPPRMEGRDSYNIVFRCDSGCDREATRYPIVLVHGYAGVDSYFGILDYFYDVVPTLGDRGFLAFTPVTSPIATSEVRAEQLDEQLQTILRDTGADRLNIIAHSQGGLDARVLVSGRGWKDRIASITTIATPHGGIPLILADFISVQDFSPEYMAEFNATYPDQDSVRYWSWSSRSCGILEPGCRRESANELVDVILGASYTLLLRFGENDGVVPTASMAWGENLGLLFADHFDEVGQIADGTSGDDPFDHRAFYLSEARRLRDAGL